MTDAIPQVTLGLGAGSECVVMIGAEDHEATDLARLFTIAPELKQSEAAQDAALAVNHLAQGAAFDVILDPDAFAKGYKAKLAAEDPSADWSQDVVRLHDYGIPDFDMIQPPTTANEHLVYFAVDSYLGVPYRIEVNLGGSDITVTDDNYKAMELSTINLPDDPDMVDDDADDFVPGDDDE